MAGAALLVGDVGEPEGSPVDEFDQSVNAFRGGVGVPGEHAAGDLGAPGGDGLGQGDHLGEVEPVVAAKVNNASRAAVTFGNANLDPTPPLEW